MEYLIRKISRAKWEPRAYLKPKEISADVLGTCLRTKDSRLSVWCCDSLEAIGDTALALASAMDHLETFDVVALQAGKLTDLGLEFESSEGNTPIESLRDRHRDIAPLDVMSVCLLAEHVREQLETEEAVFRRFSQAQLKVLLRQAIHDGVLKADDLQPSVKEKIQL